MNDIVNDIPRKHLLTGEVAGNVDRVEAYRVRLSPGQEGGPHVHPGGVVGYIVEGRMALQIDGEPVQELTAGSVFFEPPGARIRRTDNMSPDEPVTFIAYYLLTGDQPLIEPD